MKRGFSAIILVFLVATAFAQVTPPATPQSAPTSTSQPQKPGEQPKGTASIEGTVMTQDGDRPIRKATVTLMSMAPSISATTIPIPNQQTYETDAAGHYVFKDLPAGPYRLSVQHAQFVGTGRQARFVSQTTSLTEGQQLKDANFRLIPAAVIRGRVTDEDGDPVARATVSVTRQQYARGGKKQLTSAGAANTDDQGEFRVGTLAPGSYWVSANRGMTLGMASVATDAKQSTRQYVRTYYPGVLDAHSASPVEVKPGDEVPVNISLLKQETVEVKGTVTLPSGEKPEMGQVMFYTSGDASPFGGYSTMLRDGAFALRVPIGAYRVMVMTSVVQGGPMPVYSNFSVDVPQQGLPELKLQSATPSKVTARVTLEGATQGVSVDNIRLQLMVHREDEDGRSIFMSGDIGNGKADKEGVVQIERLNPGNYDVNYFGGGQGLQDAYLKSVIQGSRDVLMTGARVAGAETPLQVVISMNGSRVEGTVTDGDHKPVKGASVVDVPPAELRTRDQFWRFATTDQNGHFTIHSIRPGRHILLALEDPEPGVWFDPEFMKAVESRGESYSIGEKEAKQFQLQLIPKSLTAAGQ